MKDKRKSPNYWKVEENAVIEARKIMKENKLNSLPCSEKLTNLGYSNLSHAIKRYHGGFHRFREILEEEQREMPKGIWKNLDYTVKQAKNIMEKHKLDSLPAERTLWKMGYSNLANAVIHYHGGFHRFREILEEEQREMPKGIWKNLDYTVKQAKNIMEENNFKTLPKTNKLIELKCYGLLNAIYRHHGGYSKFREIFNQKLGIKSEKQQLENLLDGYING